MSENSDEAETVQLKAEVPKHLKEQVKSELGYGGITQVVTDKLKEIARGQTVEQAERENEIRLETALDGSERMFARADECDGVIDGMAEKLRRDAIDQIHAVARENREQMADARAEVEDAIETEYETLMHELEQMLEDGQRVWESHGTVEDAAQKAGRGHTPADVIDELKERKPDIDDEKFEENPPDTRQKSPNFSSTSGD
jgi:hypothetical protein